MFILSETIASYCETFKLRFVSIPTYSMTVPVSHIPTNLYIKSVINGCTMYTLVVNCQPDKSIGTENVLILNKVPFNYHGRVKQRVIC